MKFIKRWLYWIYDNFTQQQLYWLKHFKRLEKLDNQHMAAFQMHEIKACCLAHGIRIEHWGDFRKLPILTKDDIDIPWPPPIFTHKHKTSGSTGEPRTIYVPESAWPKKDAIFTRSWEKIGRSDEWVLRLIAGEPQYSFYDWLRNVKAMNYKTIGQEHVDWVVANKPFLIHGPGGAIRQLCELLMEQGHEDLLKTIKIHWCSESSEGHRQRLEPLVKEFHEQYGLAEMPTVAATDGNGWLKLVEERCYVEILNDHGEPQPEGAEGEIIVTDFDNYITPIIRYRTGDRGTILKMDGYPVLFNIKGRGVDYYSGPEVKKAIGWWVVSPISHNLSDYISQWRVEIHPKRAIPDLTLHYKRRTIDDPGASLADHNAAAPAFRKYADWVHENAGLAVVFLESDEDTDYSADWKNKLVKVIEDE